MSPSRAALAATVLVASLLAHAALPAPGAGAQAIAPTPGVTRTSLVRPPHGSWRRGLWSVPAPAAVVLGGLVVAAAAAALIHRARSPRR